MAEEAKPLKELYNNVGSGVLQFNLFGGNIDANGVKFESGFEEKFKDMLRAINHAEDYFDDAIKKVDYDSADPSKKKPDKDKKDYEKDISKFLNKMKDSDDFFENIKCVFGNSIKFNIDAVYEQYKNSIKGKGKFFDCIFEILNDNEEAVKGMSPLNNIDIKDEEGKVDKDFEEKVKIPFDKATKKAQEALNKAKTKLGKLGYFSPSGAKDLFYNKEKKCGIGYNLEQIIGAIDALAAKDVKENDKKISKGVIKTNLQAIKKIRPSIKKFVEVLEKIHFSGESTNLEYYAGKLNKAVKEHRNRINAKMAMVKIVSERLTKSIEGVKNEYKTEVREEGQADKEEDEEEKKKEEKEREASKVFAGTKITTTERVDEKYKQRIIEQDIPKLVNSIKTDGLNFTKTIDSINEKYKEDLVKNDVYDVSTLLKDAFEACTVIWIGVGFVASVGGIAALIALAGGPMFALVGLAIAAAAAAFGALTTFIAFIASKIEKYFERREKGKALDL